MSGFEDLDVVDFLSSLRLGTRKVYECGLKLFGQFYADKGAISDFLDFVERDRLLPTQKAKPIIVNIAVWKRQKKNTKNLTKSVNNATRT